MTCILSPQMDNMAKKRKAKAPADESATNAARKYGEQERYYYDYDDLAKITGKSRNALYQATARGTLDPSDFEAVLYFVARHATLDRKKKFVEYILDPSSAKNPAKK